MERQELKAKQQQEDADNARRVALLAWAAQRTGLRITLSGGTDSVGAVTEALGSAAASFDTRASGNGNTVSAAWSTAATPQG